MRSMLQVFKMRQRYAVATCVAFSFLLLFIARHHLRDLYEVARTYSTFHKTIARHPDILYRYPPPERPNQGSLAPKIIHQIFLSEGRNSSSLSRYVSALGSCQQLHPDWTHNLWTDDNATSFIRTHYPALAPHYESYKQSIQRANILRYALLDHFGGVYLDLDVTCLVPLDELLHLPWLTPGAYPAGVNNAFILSRPHHGFLTEELLRAVPSRDIKWPMPYVENMLSTGCMFFSNRWMRYMRRVFRQPGGVAGEDMLYILADQQGDMEPHMLRGKVRTPLFAHGGASSWHGWDAAAIVVIGKYYGWFASLAGVSAVATVLLLVRCLTGRSLRRRRSIGNRLSSARSSLDKREDEERLLVLNDG